VLQDRWRPGKAPEVAAIFKIGESALTVSTGVVHAERRAHGKEPKPCPGEILEGARGGTTSQGDADVLICCSPQGSGTDAEPCNLVGRDGKSITLDLQGAATATFVNPLDLAGGICDDEFMQGFSGVGLLEIDAVDPRRVCGGLALPSCLKVGTEDVNGGDVAKRDLTPRTIRLEFCMAAYVIADFLSGYKPFKASVYGTFLPLFMTVVSMHASVSVCGASITAGSATRAEIVCLAELLSYSGVQLLSWLEPRFIITKLFISKSAVNLCQGELG